MMLKKARFVAHSDDEDAAGGLSLLGCLEDPEEKVPTRKRGKQSVDSPCAPSAKPIAKGKAKAAAGGERKQGGAEMPPTKRLREITTTIRSLTEAQSVLAMVNRAEGWPTLSSAQCLCIAINLEKRLVPHWALTYVGGASIGVDEDPSEILVKIRRYHPQMCKLATFMQAFTMAFRSAQQ